jgi:hypothetical protein
LKIENGEVALLKSIMEKKDNDNLFLWKHLMFASCSMSSWGGTIKTPLAPLFGDRRRSNRLKYVAPVLTKNFLITKAVYICHQVLMHHFGLSDVDPEYVPNA